MNSARAVAVDAPVQWITEFGEAGTSSAIASIEVVSGASGSPADIEVLFSSRLQDISASAEVLVNWRSGGGNLVTRLGEVLDLAPAISPLTRGLIGFRGASGTSSVALSRAEFSNGSIIPSIDVGDIGVFRAIKTSGGNLEVLDKASWSNADISEGWGGLTGINGGMAVWQNAGNLVFSEEAVGV
jgi:hypothetical protein